MNLRNVAIIAHVDHGKTTLVDGLLWQSGAFRENQRVAQRAMDSNDLERERGITILAKCTSVDWQDHRINIVDTPGHADFGGEVERILSMVDGVLLLVDAAEGPMPQTKFVTAKALRLGLRPIVVINKIDRPDARPEEVHEEVFDLFVALEASDDQLDFPVIYASAKEGWASLDSETRGDNLVPLFEAMVAHVPEPEADGDGAFRMLATMLEADPYLGRVLTGRVASGKVRPNTMVRALSHDGREIERVRVTKVLVYRGLERVPADEVVAGDIVALAGFARATVADTLADPEVTEPIAANPIDPPTLSMTFSVNDSPLAGRDGSKVTSRMIRDRLFREAEGNVAISVTQTADDKAYEVSGRGELQLAVLIETMRREGFELGISRPRVLMQTCPATGGQEEPMEMVLIDVDEEFSGVVVEGMADRRGEMSEMRPSGAGRVRLGFRVPTRGLIGYHGEFLTETRGTGVINRLFSGYGPHRGPIQGRRNGVLISNAGGASVAYALANLEDRGPMFIGSGVPVYAGMIIGEHSRGNDLEVNPLKAKQLSNIRTTLKDEAVRLTTPRRLSLEDAIAYIADDELVEVTPQHMRLRKRLLDPHERKKAERRLAAG